MWTEATLTLHRASQELKLSSCAIYGLAERAQRNWILGKLAYELQCSHQNVAKAGWDESQNTHLSLRRLNSAQRMLSLNPKEAPKLQLLWKFWNIGAIIFKMRAICSGFPYMKQHDYNRSHILLFLHHVVTGTCCWHTEEGGYVYCVGCDPPLLWRVRQLELLGCVWTE